MLKVCPGNEIEMELSELIDEMSSLMQRYRLGFTGRVKVKLSGSIEIREAHGVGGDYAPPNGAPAHPRGKDGVEEE